ncbi:MAG TPA: helix-turn-helix transcriptional regulator [Bryobacteraceae bacterium]|nr:helix-turn-helix transcriptional regulator [Bryobacteraceae bacterium]
MRHAQVLTGYDPKRGVSIATLAYEYPAQYQVTQHAHGSDQLIYAVSGLMEVSSEQSVWVIPPHTALWIPARTQHQIHMRGTVSMRTLYVRRGLVTRRETRCAVLHVTPLLRELIVEIVRVGQVRVRDRYEQALGELLLAQLKKASAVPTFITLPKDIRALSVARAILRDPAELKPLSARCATAGVSVRTIERAFRREVGTDFESWRRQVRLTKAVELLVSGCSVKEVAGRVGYRQTSAFVEMFRRSLGATPKAWISGLNRESRAFG